MIFKYKYLFVVLGIAYSTASADTQKPSAEAGPNVRMVESISPGNSDAIAVRPFPEQATETQHPADIQEDAALDDQRKRMLAEGQVQDGQAAPRFPDKTTYGPSSGTTDSGTSSRSGSSQQDVMTTKQALMEKISPVSPEVIKEALSNRDKFSASLNQNVINSVPRSSSQTISLSPGASQPVVRVAPGRPTYIVFEDITGAPWPLAEKVINSGGDNRFYVRSFTDTPIVLVQPMVTYGNGDIGVLLKDLPVPITIVLANTETSANDKTFVYDSRINLRIPRRGPMAPAHSITSISKIALSSPELQSMLDGIAPADATRLKTDNPDVKAWRRGDKLYLRTTMESKSQFSKTLSSADGTHVYEMELSPFVALMQQGSTVTVKVEI
ncbi:DotH/IcmK family type IV secretion protein [Escherichia coli]|nr:DotH/IcmK family type IV secretion protein [Escherichia coli]MDY8698476.1 DotH/IcmK family type IV secretion protein [Escherichia coli]MDY8725047.1 DotH/IcmK family type IV secretion protein [Escherichia coli]MDY8846073.1 DotH/IcmK family type IV secretion protein [Escherichia coli]